ncbi:hypothetical protein [Clostridium oryzae]|uniref:hypothetical protein n=1 Tax=Clostridium oryzae TaxID=1450648 RepID=UPI001472E43F|nr:hypothetical protein [Clostridium oryzae]
MKEEILLRRISENLNLIIGDNFLKTKTIPSITKGLSKQLGVSIQSKFSIAEF